VSIEGAGELNGLSPAKRNSKAKRVIESGWQAATNAGGKMRGMLKFKVLVPTCLIVLMAGLIPVAAQTAPQGSMPSVDEILDKYVEALGGKVALEKVTSRVAKGTFEMDQMPGEATEEIYEKAPNKQLAITDNPSFGVVKRGFNGTAGWQDMPQTGLVDVTGDELTAMKRHADFHWSIKLKELYPKMTVKGKESVGGRDAYVVEATPAEGPAETMYFDADTGLLVRLTGEADTPNGPVTIDMTFEDYRDVDGVKVPFTIHESFGDFGFVIKLTDVKQNVPIDDAKFDKPAEQ
jgi:zinc protease